MDKTVEREPGLKTASRTPKLKSSSTKGAKYSLVMTISISNLKIKIVKYFKKLQSF